MKRKIFAALLSLTAIVGMALPDFPEVRLSAQGSFGVLPYEEFTFTILYRNVQEMVVEIDEVYTDNIYLWPWQKEDPDWRTMDYTDKIMDYEKSATYKVIVYNEQLSASETIVYTTPGPPYTGR